MIITFLISIVVTILSLLFLFFPVVTIADIPIFGEFMSSTLYTAVTYWNSFMLTFPYAETAWNMFLLFVIPFEIGLLVLKFFLGHRTPVNV